MVPLGRSLPSGEDNDQKATKMQSGILMATQSGRLREENKRRR